MKRLRRSFFLLILILTGISVILISFQNSDMEKIPKMMDEQEKARHYAEVADNYLRGLNEQNLELILSLYADNATVEDPVGSPVRKGKAALREFYTGAVKMDLQLTRTGPVRVAGHEAAFPFQLRMEIEGYSSVTGDRKISVARKNRAILGQKPDEMQKSKRAGLV